MHAGLTRYIFQRAAPLRLSSTSESKPDQLPLCTSTPNPSHHLFRPLAEARSGATLKASKDKGQQTKKHAISSRAGSPGMRAGVRLRACALRPLRGYHGRAHASEAASRECFRAPPHGGWRGWGQGEEPVGGLDDGHGEEACCCGHRRRCRFLGPWRRASCSIRR